MEAPFWRSGYENQRPQSAQGTIVDIVKGATTSHVRIDVGGGTVMTASITNEAVDDLKLAKGQQAIAVIKATDVMVAIER